MVGVYMLYWEQAPYYYIGKSYHVTKRYETHKYLLLAKSHVNKRMQAIYDKYGLPMVRVLDRVNSNELSEKEKAYIALNYAPEYCLNRVDIPIQDKPMIITLSDEMQRHVNRIKGVTSAEYIKRLIQRDLNGGE